MAGSTVTRPASKARDAKAFSRRFDTSEQHNKAQRAWDKRQDDVMDGVVRRAAARAERSPQEQLSLLLDRPGESRKERAKLRAAIAAQAKSAA